MQNIHERAICEAWKKIVRINLNPNQLNKEYRDSQRNECWWQLSTVLEYALASNEYDQETVDNVFLLRDIIDKQLLERI